jgi:hypothetical protein
MPRRPTKNSKAIQATLEFSFLHGGPFSQHLLDSVLLNFVDELEESLHEDADDALICVVVDGHEVAMLLIERDGTVLTNEKALQQIQKMWKLNFETNAHKLIPVFVDHLRQNNLGVAGVKWMDATLDQKMPMNVESIPKFTAPAAKLWAKVPAEFKKRLLSNVWCAHCRQEVTITNFSGTVKGGDLVLEGLCSKCDGPVGRLIESN